MKPIQSTNSTKRAITRLKQKRKGKMWHGVNKQGLMIQKARSYTLLKVMCYDYSQQN